MRFPSFSGVYTALVTPFHEDGSVDYATFERLVELQCDAGVHGVVVGVSTGEGTALDLNERLELIKRAIVVANKRVKVIAGAAHNLTSSAVELQRAVQELDIDATLQSTPWYNKATQEGMYRHFKAIAEAARVPVILYNAYGRTGVDLDPSTTLRLCAELPQIIGIKEVNLPNGRLQSLLQGLKAIRPEAVVLSGEDDATLQLLALGGHGVISVSSNYAPKEMLALYNAYKEARLEDASALSWRLNDLAKLAFYRCNPVCIKHMMAMKGLMKQAYFRLPLCELSAQEQQYLYEGLARTGWL